ncbi:hypothetical protein L6452_33456 [Arctium lappa]|uniref:Uncharacterized protein n=1 Tax=Arctium lappa TaxID=4217 RepID=A0ACB8YJN9_ARCLA|nr:hypothetical protein L6452_33456 [Arctium lappa]
MKMYLGKKRGIPNCKTAAAAARITPPMLNLFRVERALNFTITYQISKSVPYFQRCYSCGGMNYNSKMVGGKSNRRNAERKNQKSAAPVWRPVSTQSCSADVKDVDDGVNVEVGSRVKRYEGSSSGVLESQDGHRGAKLAEPNIVDKEEGKAFEGSVSSTDKHSISLEVGSSLLRFIKGKGGSMQEKIEGEMGIKIIFPSSRTEDSIIIEGSSPDSVARASERIQLIIGEVVKSSALDYSHFVSLPLALYPQLVDQLVNFQSSILGMHDPNPDEVLDSSSNKDTTDEEDRDQKVNKAPQVAVTLKAQEDGGNVKVDVTNIPRVSYPPKSQATSASKPKSSTLFELGIDKSIFIKPKTFHLTVLMLKLWNKERVNAAVRIFESIADEVMDALDGQPVSIRLKGLDCMRGSPAKARVLYAPVEVVGGEDRLLQACKVITDAFIKGGLVLEKDAKQALKLHATVMNARHRKSKTKTRNFDSFDARGIMEQFGSKEWGEYLIREVHLSQRFVFDEDGYYHRCASIPLPENPQAD